MIRTAIVIASVILGAGAVAAQQSAQRESVAVMKASGRALGGTLTPMVKGEKPYDQGAVDAALAQLEETAKKLPGLYPDSMRTAKLEGDYLPSPKIWESRADFDARIASFARAVARARASIKDLDTLKAAVPAIGRECGGCHENFRLKNS